MTIATVIIYSYVVALFMTKVFTYIVVQYFSCIRVEFVILTLIPVIIEDNYGRLNSLNSKSNLNFNYTWRVTIPSITHDLSNS